MRKVSVLIATYNMAEYLPLAIDSALRQDYPDFEIVVVDDGSTDSTPAVAAAYGDRIRYHRQANTGVAGAYNTLLNLAGGDYLHHLDADDLLLPGALRRLAALLDDNPSVGLAYGAALVIDSNGRVYDRRHTPRWIEKQRIVPSAGAFKELLHGCHITTSTVMMRRSVLETVTSFQSDCVPGEDWDMWMRVAAQYDLAYEPETIAHYRVHPTSITAGYTVDRVLASHENTLARIFSDPAFRYAPLRGYAFACLDRTVALTAARLRDRRMFARRLASALRKSPGLLLERETLGVACEGLKTLLPRPLLAAGRKIRHREVATRRREGMEGQA